ncbi:Uncharacterized protein APZ42_002756 [Daphnia magna]|uniref:Uncharacterized protein n=1 Tax=Daphnia magna TaxID=35525 RepID=A0A164I269_9CRUS|nr:Uncharacterized protein APZ42_002756 [Daphnia magna]
MRGNHVFNYHHSIRERCSQDIVQFKFSSCPDIFRDAKHAGVGRKEMVIGRSYSYPPKTNRSVNLCPSST